MLVTVATGCGFTTRSAPPRTFDGSSSALSRTAVLATLDDAFPVGSNAIWCAAFELALDRLRLEALHVDDICFQDGGRIRTSNPVREGADTFLPDDSYAYIFGCSPATLSQHGPKELLDQLASDGPPGADDSFVKAMLCATCAFKCKFAEGVHKLEFPDSDGTKARVRYFGIEGPGDNRELREEVRVLFCDDFAARGAYGEFCLDLSRQSSPFQVMVATVERKDTLHEMVDSLDKKVRDWSPKEGEEAIHDGEAVSVPNMKWRIAHHFTQFEGQQHRFADGPLKGLYFREAAETIDFSLDREGMRLDAKAIVGVASRQQPRAFVFDKPFLLIVKQHGAKSPCFVMWVKNSELLDKLP
jgi:hypothetical protein